MTITELRSMTGKKLRSFRGQDIVVDSHRQPVAVLISFDLYMRQQNELYNRLEQLRTVEERALATLRRCAQ